MRHLALYAVGIFVVVLGSLVVFLWYTHEAPGAGSSYDAQIAACNAYPNGMTVNVAETSRLTIHLPKALYPNQQGLLSFTNESGTASAGWISNAGPPSEAYGATADCFAYYYDFEGTGIVGLTATSSIPGVPEYIIHFSVESAGTPPTSTGTVPVSPPAPIQQGIVQGIVQLGPTCPVERIPPEPQCAPKPYATTIRVQPTNLSTPYTTTESNASGAFRISLNPGTYILTPQGGGSMPPTCRETQVAVVAGKTQNITLDCDTGIR